MLLFVTQEMHMPEKTDFETLVANMLKAELKRQGVTYAQLVEKLAAIGVEEKEVNIRNKLARGKFSAAFMVACLKAIGVREVRCGVNSV
jgi:ribosomal protein L20